MRNNGIKYTLRVLTVVGTLLVLTVAILERDTEPAFAQAESSDHASMSMNTTTTSSGSKMHSFGKGVPVLVHISAGDGTSS